MAAQVMMSASVRIQSLVLGALPSGSPTTDTVLHGFGLEGVTTAAQRTEIMGRTLDYLIG